MRTRMLQLARQQDTHHRAKSLKNVVKKEETRITGHGFNSASMPPNLGTGPGRRRRRRHPFFASATLGHAADSTAAAEEMNPFCAHLSSCVCVVASLQSYI
jgi:hypothetical protein|uniref:Uncharacterized protein n=1 Tax=Zea mays TaxID=4577 RepID=A0A804MWN5_MAIZE